MQTTRKLPIYAGSPQQIPLDHDERIIGVVGQPKSNITGSSGGSGGGTIIFDHSYDINLIIIKAGRPQKAGEPPKKDVRIHVVASGQGINAEHLHHLGSLYVNNSVCYTIYEEIQNL